MRQSRAEKKKRLLARAEAIIDELLQWSDDTEKPTLTDIEDVVLQLRKELGIEMAKEVMEMQEENHPVPGPRCPKCGREMQYKGQKEHSVESRIGMLKGERGYYHCPACGEGVFPPGSAADAERQAME